MKAVKKHSRDMKCVIPNYIPYKNNKKIKFSRWLHRYKGDILYMYDTFYKIESERYNEDFKQPSDKDLTRFAYFIYTCSSKHIQQ